MLINIDNKSLKTASENFWVAPDANIIGDVYLDEDASVWFNATLEEIVNR